MKHTINNLEEKDAKSLLLQFYHHTQLVDERKGYSEEQFFLNIKNAFHDIMEVQKNQSISDQTQLQATHIVFGDSASGSLKFALKEQKKEKVIPFSDLFSIGPVWHLHDAQGITHRFEWLKKHLGMEEEELFNYERKFKRTLLEIEEIPSHHPILIWAGKNPHEQTGLRLALYLLKEKKNDIFIIHTDETFHHLFTTHHMGEFNADQLQQMYENEKNRHALTQKQRKTLEQQWEQLSAEKYILRRWENNEVIHVPETYYDEFIINTVKRLHQEQNDTEYFLAARIIGEVVGHLDQYIGDQFIEYRVIRLIVDGIFDVDGVPKSMLQYRIKIR